MSDDLQIAIWDNDAERVRSLLAAGAGLASIDEEGAFAEVMSAEIATLLIAHGADVNTPHSDGCTPLICAACNGAPDVVRVLLKHGADLHYQYDRGFTVLMAAAGGNDTTPECIQLLLDAGADPKAVSLLGWNALHASVDVSRGGASDWDAFPTNRRAVMRLLVEAGTDLEQRNLRGLTPLARAVIDGSPFEAHALLELGADATVRVEDCGHVLMPPGGTLLMFDYYDEETPGLFRALLAAGADPRARSTRGLTALGLASREERGDNPHARDCAAILREALGDAPGSLD